MPETVIDMEILEASDGDGDLSAWFKRKKLEAFLRENKKVLIVGGLAVGGLVYWALKDRGR